ncbi:hypothetical protein A0H81_07914 [Grifola frondosa]|uniref:Uncharacterized protein n=1 Tax=Grifola frondosa TaxID=5627 RepID=A0A1C7M768_GRIFR|nr:hypothetical protein A0H81_07914 [Grifola frondosa]
MFTSTHVAGVLTVLTVDYLHRRKGLWEYSYSGDTNPLSEDCRRISTLAMEFSIQTSVPTLSSHALPLTRTPSRRGAQPHRHVHPEENADAGVEATHDPLHSRADSRGKGT